MKYICFGYIEPGKFENMENMSESERNAMLDGCFLPERIMVFTPRRRC
jgi:hypothetical protein